MIKFCCIFSLGIFGVFVTLGHVSIVEAAERTIKENTYFKKACFAVNPSKEFCDKCCTRHDKRFGVNFVKDSLCSNFFRHFLFHLNRLFCVCQANFRQAKFLNISQ